jgi:hypothetical protein
VGHFISTKGISLYLIFWGVYVIYTLVCGIGDYNFKIYMFVWMGLFMVMGIIDILWGGVGGGMLIV